MLRKSIFALATLALLGSPIPAVFAQTSAWTTKAPMLMPRADLIAGAFDGYIFAGQGVSSGTAGQFERYDPSTDTWISRSTPADTYSRAGAVIGGLLYGFGGVEHGGPLNKVNAYDPVTNTWSARAGMPTQRAGATAAVVDGKAYVWRRHGFRLKSGKPG